MNFKLNFEMVPESCWYSNLRSLLSAAQWNLVRQEAYERADGRCMICGRKVTRLEAHERWSYDEESNTQILSDVVAVCNACHSTIHIGRSQLTGKGKEAKEWFMKVNGCTYAQMRSALGKANEDHQRRNRVPEWKLDLRYLQKFVGDR